MIQRSITILLGDIKRDLGPGEVVCQDAATTASSLTRGAGSPAAARSSPLRSATGPPKPTLAGPGRAGGIRTRQHTLELLRVHDVVVLQHPEGFQLVMFGCDGSASPLHGRLDDCIGRLATKSEAAGRGSAARDARPCGGYRRPWWRHR